MKKVSKLIYFTNGSIGDFLMSLYCCENVYLNDSNIQIHIITPRNKSLFIDLARGYPYIHIHEINKRNVWKLAPFLFSKNIVLVPPSPKGPKGFLSYISIVLSLFGERVYFGKGGVTFNPNQAYHEMLAEGLISVGMEIKKEKPQLIYLREDTGIVDTYNLVSKEYIVIHPYASHSGKSIHGSVLRSLITSVKEKYPHKQIVVTGSEGDREHLENDLRSVSGVQNMAGMVSIPGLIDIINQSYLFIGNDTGITHLACMLGVRSIVFAHAGTTKYWLPVYNEKVQIYSVLNKESKRDLYPFSNVTSEFVTKIIND